MQFYLHSLEIANILAALMQELLHHPLVVQSDLNLNRLVSFPNGENRFDAAFYLKRDDFKSCPKQFP